MSFLVPRKGADYGSVDTVIDNVARELDSLGFKRVCFRSDNEDALLVFLDALKRGGQIVRSCQRRPPRVSLSRTALLRTP